jgi:hypothetical protein
MRGSTHTTVTHTTVSRRADFLATLKRYCLFWGEFLTAKFCKVFHRGTDGHEPQIRAQLKRNTQTQAHTHTHTHRHRHSHTHTRALHELMSVLRFTAVYLKSSCFYGQQPQLASLFQSEESCRSLRCWICVLRNAAGITDADAVALRNTCVTDSNDSGYSRKTCWICIQACCCLLALDT